MKARRLFVTAAAPVALLLSAAGAAHAAAPKVSFRVEGPSKTLLAARTVTAPSSGSITKGGTPTGSCPADSAAGALNVATHGDWSGTYSSGLGIDVTSILGTTLSYSKGSYWSFYIDNRLAPVGVCDAKLTAGESLLFAAVPAKGKTPLPLVESAPKAATVGHAFTLKTFVYPGKGNATKSVSGNVTITGGGGKVSVHRTSTGDAQLTATKPGTYTITAGARGEIRSAPVTVKVTK